MGKNNKNNNSKNNSKTITLSIFLKGVLIGICAIIPGISGGTIAFITGIYTRLINAIKNITLKNYISLIFTFFTNKSKHKEIIKKIDLLFLITLFGGTLTAILLGAKILSFFIENYYVYVFALFIGLIIASGLLIQKEIDIKTYKNQTFGIIGFLVGITLLFFSPKEVIDPSALYVGFGGFMAIAALFLPGFSGSFLLVIMGLYEYIINIVKNISTEYTKIIPFLIGAILGAYLISRIISFLFEKDKSKTLYFLLGLVFGTLIIPIRNVYQSIPIIKTSIVVNIIVFVILGFFIVRWTNILANKN